MFAADSDKHEGVTQSSAVVIATSIAAGVLFLTVACHLHGSGAVAGEEEMLSRPKTS